MDRQERQEQIKSLDANSKAGQLARELNAERGRLKKELEEAKEIFTSGYICYQAGSRARAWPYLSLT